MNRETKRKILKGKITEQELQEFLAVENKRVMALTVHNYSVVLALTLRDKLKFGTERTSRFLEQVQELFDSVNEGYTEVKDIEEQLHEELGIEFRYK